MARGDYAGAAARYREAVQKEPESLTLHFALGNALSRLNQVDETAQEFAWVLEHGRPDQQEVAMARQWLIEAGRLSEPATASTSPSVPSASEPAAPDTAPDKPTVGYGALKGKTLWPGLPKDDQPVTLDLRVTGEGPNAANQFRFHIGLGKPYTMSRLPAGPYRVVGRVRDLVLWDTRVVIAPNAETVLDLTPQNSQVDPTRTPLPGARGSSG